MHAGLAPLKKELCHARCKQCLKRNLPFYSQKCKMMNIFARSVPCQSTWWNTCTHVIYCKLNILPKFRTNFKNAPVAMGDLQCSTTEYRMFVLRANRTLYSNVCSLKVLKCLKFVRNTLRGNSLHVYLYLHL